MQRHNSDMAFQLANDRIKELEARGDHWREAQKYRSLQPSRWSRLVDAFRRPARGIPLTLPRIVGPRPPKTVAEALTRVGFAVDSLDLVTLEAAAPPLVRQAIREVLTALGDAGIEHNLSTPDEHDDISLSLRTLGVIADRTSGLHITLSDVRSRGLADLITRIEQLRNTTPAPEVVVIHAHQKRAEVRWTPPRPAGCVAPAPACV